MNILWAQPSFHAFLYKTETKFKEAEKKSIPQTPIFNNQEANYVIL